MVGTQVIWKPPFLPAGQLTYPPTLILYSNILWHYILLDETTPHHTTLRDVDVCIQKQQFGRQLKLQHVPFFCILLLQIQILLPSSLAKQYGRPMYSYFPSTENSYFNASLGAINDTYRVFTESPCCSGNVTRHQLVSMSSDAQGLVYLPHES